MFLTQFDPLSMWENIIQTYYLWYTVIFLFHTLSCNIVTTYFYPFIVWYNLPSHLSLWNWCLSFHFHFFSSQTLALLSLTLQIKAKYRVKGVSAEHFDLFMKHDSYECFANTPSICWWTVLSLSNASPLTCITECVI